MPSDRTNILQSTSDGFLTPDVLYDQTLTGGQRSLLNLKLLSRFAGRLPEPSQQNITDLLWRPAAGLTIERVFQSVWHTGHANAILPIDPAVVVASQTGGVWLVNFYPDTIPVVGSHPATPLSNDWDNPDMNCLAFAPGDNHQFYAGGTTILYLVQVQPVLGGLVPKASTVIPLPVNGNINQILVLPVSRRIVVATDFGILWSDIPAVPSDAGSYLWKIAQGIGFDPFSGLAEGPNETVVATAWGTSVSTDPHGAFLGTWTGENLVFSAAPMVGVDITQMRRTSVASSPADRSVLYCAAAATDGSLLAVLTSTTGGASWQPVTNIPVSLTGLQGDYNNVIAVSPLRSSLVVLGWRAGGYFFSNDGGATWTQPHTDGGANALPDLHGDVHALAFDASGTVPERLFGGSDGGVVSTPDLGLSYESMYNSQLQTLQFYPNAMSVSSRFPGLIAGGTQDNGNISCNSTDEAARWQTLEPGDGGTHRFVDSLGAILRFNNTLQVNGVEVGNRVRIGFWNAATASFDGLGQVVPVDGNAGGLQTPLIEVVLSPFFRRNGQLMYAIAGQPGGGQVYGVFANADGSGATLQTLGNVNDTIASIASRDGSTVLVGTSSSRLISLDSATGVSTDITLPQDFQSGTFVRLADLEPRRAFALHSSGRLLRFDGSSWQSTNGAGFLLFEADPQFGSQRVFAANDTSVWLSMDNGATWTSVSAGLPARPHCSDLRLGADGQGGHYLYLATYGRSVWKAPVDFVAHGPDFGNVPQLVGSTIFGILGDGGGLVRVGNQIFRIPPESPYRDIVAGIAVAYLAGAMSPEIGRPVQVAALKAVQEAAKRQIQQLEVGE